MSSFTIGKKLYLGVATLLVLIAVLGIVSVLSMGAIGDRVHEITERTVRRQTLAHQMALANAEMLAAERGIEVRGFMKDSETVEKYHGEFLAAADGMQSSFDSIAPLLITAEGQAAVQSLRDSLARIRQIEDPLHRGAASGDMDSSGASYVAILPYQAAQKKDIADILQVQDSLLARDTEAVGSSILAGRWIAGAMLAGGLATALLIFFVVRGINNLLRKSVQDLADASGQIAAAASQVSSSSQSLAQGSSEQAATIEETSSVSTEINSMAQRNSENSRTTAEIVNNSQAGFERTKQSLTEMVGAMENISSSSQKISKIIKVIDEIAFQTNILALNAAVEAARAGEAGMGFAVVADEVRNLAQRCAKAAQDTAALIEDSIQKSDGGKVRVDHVASAIREITEESSRIKGLVDEINLGSAEQSRGIDQISRSITQMEQVTQSNAANAEETAAAAEELSAQAATMKEVVNRLRQMVDGAGEKKMPPPAKRPLPPAKRPKDGLAVKTRVSVGAKPSGSTRPRSAAVAASHDAFPMEGDFSEF